MPTSQPDEYEIRLKPDARARMADAARAAGEQITPGHHGQPSGNALIRKANGVARNLFTVGVRPGNTSLGRLGALHGQRLGVDPFTALRDLCDVVNLRTGEVVDCAHSPACIEIGAAA